MTKTPYTLPDEVAVTIVGDQFPDLTDYLVCPNTLDGECDEEEALVYDGAVLCCRCGEGIDRAHDLAEPFIDAYLIGEILDDQDVAAMMMDIGYSGSYVRHFENRLADHVEALADRGHVIGEIITLINEGRRGRRDPLSRR